jgi:hypothetical protein
MFLGAGLTLLILRLTGKRSRNAPAPEIPPEEEHTPGETK